MYPEKLNMEVMNLLLFGWFRCFCLFCLFAVTQSYFEPSKNLSIPPEDPLEMLTV